MQLLHLGVRGGCDIDGILAGTHHAHVYLRRGRGVDAVGHLGGSGSGPLGSIGSPSAGTAELQIPVIVSPPATSTEVESVGKQTLWNEEDTQLWVDEINSHATVRVRYVI